MNHERRNILISHADEPLGRRLVKCLHYDEAVESILAVGAGPPPHAFDRFLRGDSAGRLSYIRVDLARHRPVNDLFHSSAVRRDQIDTVIHLPHRGSIGRELQPALAGVPDRTSEARLVLQHCLEVASIRHLIAIGSACVYRLVPGNANRLTERSEIEFDPDLPAETRSWVDCDMLFHAEIHNERLGVTLLRLPTVVGQTGSLLMNPSLETPETPAVRAMGFDPMCALVADGDVVRAVQLALHRRAEGIFNIAGRESLPLSVLARWAGGRSLGIPGPLLRGLAGAARLLGAERARASLDGPHLHYGFTLNTELAESSLGFQPRHRIALGRGDDGRPRIETSPI